MIRRIVSAGLPSHVASFLARQIEDVSVLMTFSGDDALTEVRTGRCSLLILDSDIPGLPAEAVLRALQEDNSLDGLKVVYCLAEAERSTQESSRQRLLRDFPGIRVLPQPLGVADVARIATQLLNTPDQLSSRPVPSVLPLRRAS
jgi:hypothetical protein